MSKAKKTLPQAAMERIQRQILRDLENKNFSSIEEANRYIQEKYLGTGVNPVKSKQSPKDKAQDLIYDAWESGDPEEMVRLAERALELDEDCADAYNILAEHKTETLEQIKEYYLKAVEAGKRSLGEDFEAYKGSFWSALETRPFMRAMAGYSDMLWLSGERSKSIEVLKEMLELNPGDNQGMRHILITRLLILKHLVEAEKLWMDYEDDFSAEWHYSRAYLYFKKSKTRHLANDALKEALEYNPYVPLYLFGLWEFPEEPPQYIGVGDENEAISYVYEALPLWADDRKATTWLVGMYEKMEDELNRLIGEREKKEEERLRGWFGEDQ